MLYASERVPVAAIDREDPSEDAQDGTDQCADACGAGRPADESTEADADKEGGKKNASGPGGIERGRGSGRHVAAIVTAGLR